MNKPTMTTLTARIDELESLVLEMQSSIDELKSKPSKSERDYGPSSTRKVTDTDAYEIKFGQYKNVAVKIIADELGLSRGQIYSIRGNYTFRHVVELDEQSLIESQNIAMFQNQA